MFQGFKMRCLFWFLPAVVIPLICLQLSSGQPSSTATVDTRSTPQPPLPLKAQLPQVTQALPEIKTSQVRRPPTKKQAKKVIPQKHPPKAKTESTDEPNQMVTAELVGSGLKLNYCGLSRAIVYLKEQYAVGNIEEKI